MSRVSICSAVLNQSEFFKDMVQSVVDQSFKDWELIVVDDGSTEDIKGLCESFNDERIQYHRFPENRGVPHGINYALSLASEDYVGLLSADERITVDKLLWQTGYLDDHPDIGGLWGLPQNGDLGERPVWEQYALKAHNRSREAWVRTLLNLENIPIGGASWLVRRSVLEDIGYFDPQFYTCSDLELFVRFFQKYEGIVFNYRWAWEQENPLAIRKQITQESFQEDIRNVRKKHAMLMPPDTGRVTVAIPVKNMEKFLPDTLESLSKQTYQDFEVVIFDDGSTVPVEGATYRMEESVGPIAAQNHMLGLCTNPFFMVLAADDTISPTFLEECMSKFKADPWLEFVATQTDFMKEDGSPLTEGHPFLTIPKAVNKPREVWLSQLYYGNHYFGAGVYRTKAAKEVGGWDGSLGVIADYEMYVKLLQRENIYVIDKSLTHTRTHDGQRSILKTREQQQELRQHYHTVRKTYYPPRQKIIFATPFYEMRGFSPYITSLAGTIHVLSRMNIDHEYWELSGDSYVDRAKNTLFNKFLEDPDATDLFMIDSDMQWQPQAVLNMLSLPEDIVMASYPQKNMWEKYTAIPAMSEADEQGKYHPIGRMLGDGSALLKAQFLSGGFIRIKRAALEKYKEAYKDYVYHDQGADPNHPDRLYTEFFTCERKNAPDGTPLRWGEDRVFGRRMQEIGIESWIYPNANLGHYGVKGWTGNYDQFLRKGTQTQ